MTPDVLAVLALGTLTMAAAVTVAWIVTGDHRIEPRRAVRPPVDGARVAGPGAVCNLYDLPRDEPAIDETLIRPYVTHPLGQRLGHNTARPAPLPGPSDAACRLCHDGTEVIGVACILCGCTARAVAR